MTTRRNGESRRQRSTNIQSEGLNWVLIAGGALLSTLSVRLGFKLKQALDSKQQASATSTSKGNGISDRRRSPGHRVRSNMYSFTQDDDGCFNCISGTEGIIKHPSNGQLVSESDVSLPLVTVPPTEFNKENGGVIWASSPDRLELPPKRLHHSNCSDSPCVSESGSDIFTKREVIQKLRQQLKRRDDMILEMHDQVMELQNSMTSQVAHSNHLQSQIDALNIDLFDSEREIQRLRKAIADHCVGNVGNNEKSSPVVTATCPSDVRNGYANGYPDMNYERQVTTGRVDGERIEMLKREVGELKEVIEGKEYLLNNYKEQTAELSMKIKEMQQRLDFQLPNIL